MVIIIIYHPFSLIKIEPKKRHSDSDEVRNDAHQKIKITF